MTRDELIAEALHIVIMDFDCRDGREDEIAEMMADFAEAQLRAAWIPIRSEEDLPTSAGYYSVTLTKSDFHKEVEVAYFHYSSKGWSRVFGSPVSHYFYKGDVIAWMPLPPAYEPSEEKQNER